MDEHPQEVPDGDRPDPLDELRAELDAADDLSLDERLALLRRAEEGIARTLEGLDGL